MKEEKMKEEKKKEEIIKQNVGMDIAKDDFKVCFSVMTSGLDVVVKGSSTFANTAKGFEALIKWVNHKKNAELELHYTMEATGVYYESSAYYLHEQSQTVHVVLPNQAKKYGQSLGVTSKTDKIDAKTLSQMGLERKLRTWEPFSPHFRVLRQLTRERDALTENRTRIMNHRHAYQHQGKVLEESVVRTGEHLVFLEKQVKGIEKEIETVVDNDAPLKKRLSCVLSIKGVGLLTAVIIVSETNGFAAVENIKQLTSYAGLDVKIKESGKWKGKSKISKKGNKYIRKALYFPTFSKIQHHEPTHEKYERLKEKKGISMVAAVAQQRKLLGLIYTLWKKEEMFLPTVTDRQTSGNAQVQAFPLASSETSGNAPLQAFPLASSETSDNAQVQAFPLASSETSDNAQVQAFPLASSETSDNAQVQAFPLASSETSGNAQMQAFPLASSETSGNAQVQTFPLASSEGQDKKMWESKFPHYKIDISTSLALSLPLVGTKVRKK